MSVLIEELKNLRNRAGCGHPQGWELMRDTMNTAIKLVEAHPQADNNTQPAIALLRSAYSSLAPCEHYHKQKKDVDCFHCKIEMFFDNIDAQQQAGA
jgi:hypothetical protein